MTRRMHIARPDFDLAKLHESANSAAENYIERRLREVAESEFQRGYAAALRDHVAEARAQQAFVERFTAGRGRALCERARKAYDEAFGDRDAEG